MANRSEDEDEDGGQPAGSQKDDGGAAADDAASDAGVRYLDGGAVEIALDGSILEGERSARHGDTEHEDVPTHDSEGRALSEEDREALRATRRDEKRRRRNAAREREDRLRSTVDTQSRTISELTQRLASIEQRGTVSELQNIEKQINDAKEAAAYFKNQLAAAIQASDGAAAADLSAKMTQAANHASQLANVRQAYLNQQNQPAPLDPRQVSLADAWITKNSWYDRNNPRNPDVRVAMAVDKGLSDEGWDPTTPLYWEELTKRMKTYLPHRYAKGANSHDNSDEDYEGDDEVQTQSQNTQQRQPVREKPAVRAPAQTPGGGGGNADNSGRAGTYVLSKERVEALQQAGMWSDPAKRAKMVKRYQEQDRASRSNSAQR
jgi:hypothetical protein